MKNRKDSRGAKLELVSACFGFQITRSTGSFAELCGVGIVLDVDVSRRFQRNIESQITANGIREIGAIERVGVLARSSSLDVIRSIDVPNNTGCERQSPLNVVRPQRKLFQLLGAHRVGRNCLSSA